MQIREIVTHLEAMAPLELAESWDNVGLLVGDASQVAERVMTCLTVTPEVVAEAVQDGVQLIISHHPFPFTGVRRITTETPDGQMLLELIASGVAVYSAHTAFDSAAEGINMAICRGLGLRGPLPLVPAERGLGAGRIAWSEKPETLRALARRAKGFLGASWLQLVGRPDTPIRVVAVACGAAGGFLDAAIEAGCDAMLLGEAKFHDCLRARAHGLSLLLPGHYASERFAVEWMAVRLSELIPDLTIWASRRETEPIVILD